MREYVPMAARDYREQWDDSETGGAPCASGRGCAERDYQGNPARGPRAFCDTDRRYAGRVIRQLPETYTQLSFLLVPSGQQDERVSGSQEAPDAINTRVQAFMRLVILVAVSWEEQVRAVAGLSEIPAAAVRDGAALARACRLLGGYDDDRTGYLDTLLGLEPEAKRRPLPGSTRLLDLEPGTHVVIDQAGDAWENRERGGADAGREFLKLSGRARDMLGLSLQRRKITEVPCDGEGCGLRTLVQREAIGGGWEPVVRCTHCPQTYIGAGFEFLIARVYRAQAAALNQAS